MRIFGTIFRFLGILLSAVLLAGACLLLFATVPQLGNKALIVRSGSMVPAINVGDLVVVRPRDKGYEEGEVIAYKSPGNEGVTVTHRIAKRSPTTEGYEYSTKGDANEEEDAYRVQDSEVLGRQLLVIPYVGKVLALGKTKLGFISFVVVPASLIIVGDILQIWREVRKRRQVKRLEIASPAARRLLAEEQPRKVTEEGLRQRLIGEVPDRRMRARIRIDSLSRKLAVLVMAISLTIPSGLALYADVEESVGNTFQAAACYETDPFVDSVIEADGTFGHCCGDLSSDPAVAEPLVTGAPDSPPELDFIQISDESSVTVRFDNNKGMLSGDSAPDLRIYTYDEPFPGEADVQVSEDCSAFQSAGLFFDDPPTGQIDIDADGLSGVSFIKCVKLIDQVAAGDTFPQLGFDLDAVEALDSVIDCEAQEVELAVTPSPTPTPSSSPEVANHVVISEVQINGDGAGSVDDFVELYNPTDVAVDVSGWQLHKKIASGTSSSLVLIPAETSIASHGYLLWANEGIAVSVGAEMSNDNSLSTVNSILLEDDEDVPVDAVAWGPGGVSQYVEISPYVLNPGEGESIERKAVSTSDSVSMTTGADVNRGNGFDSDNNANDFILRSVSQSQNSSSGTEAP